MHNLSNYEIQIWLKLVITLRGSNFLMGFGNLGRKAIYFQGGHYFMGAEEQSRNLEDLGSPVQK